MGLCGGRYVKVHLDADALAGHVVDYASYTSPNPPSGISAHKAIAPDRVPYSRVKALVVGPSFGWIEQDFPGFGDLRGRVCVAAFVRVVDL